MLRQQLRQARKARHWTQKEAAKLLGITERAYRHFEAGTRNPRYSTLVRLEQVFEMSYKELLVPDSNAKSGVAKGDNETQ